MRELKVGDDIVISEASHYGKPYTIHKITKVTATRVTIDDDRVFMIRTGRKYGAGSSWYSASLATSLFNKAHDWMTVEDAEKRITYWEAENRSRLLKLQLNRVHWTKITDEQAEAIYRLAVEQGVIKDA